MVASDTSIRRSLVDWLETGRHGTPRNHSGFLGHVGHVGSETWYFCTSRNILEFNMFNISNVSKEFWMVSRIWRPMSYDIPWRPVSSQVWLPFRVTVARLVCIRRYHHRRSAFVAVTGRSVPQTEVPFVAVGTSVPGIWLSSFVSAVILLIFNVEHSSSSCHLLPERWVTIAIKCAVEILLFVVEQNVVSVTLYVSMFLIVFYFLFKFFPVFLLFSFIH